MQLSSAWGIQSLESLRDGKYMCSVIGNHSDIDTNHRGNTKFWALALSRNLINITQVFPLLYCRVYPGGKYMYPARLPISSNLACNYPT